MIKSLFHDELSAFAEIVTYYSPSCFLGSNADVPYCNNSTTGQEKNKQIKLSIPPPS